MPLSLSQFGKAKFVPLNIWTVIDKTSRGEDQPSFLATDDEHAQEPAPFTIAERSPQRCQDRAERSSASSGHAHGLGRWGAGSGSSRRIQGPKLRREAAGRAHAPAQAEKTERYTIQIDRWRCNAETRDERERSLFTLHSGVAYRPNPHVAPPTACHELLRRIVRRAAERARGVRYVRWRACPRLVALAARPR